MTGRPRDAVLTMPVYRPGRSAAMVAAEYGIDDVVKLASNELPFGPLPTVVDAIREATADLSMYPDHRAMDLRHAIASAVGVPVCHVTVGAGSVGLLQQLVLAYVEAGDAVAFGWPSFEAYPLFASLVGADRAAIALRRQTIDLDALAAAVDADTKLVLIANPNNPTGTVVGTDELVAFVERVPSDCLVVIDEAYAEFVTDPRVRTAVSLVDQFPNVVVLRTFSKAHALASLRAGYAIAQPGVVDVLDLVLLPFAVNGLAQSAAIASLAADDEMRVRVADVVAERARITSALRHSGWGVPEPQGNFVWLPGGAASDAVGSGLERLGVVARTFSDVGVRVTVADRHANDRFLDAFAKVAVDIDPAAWQLPTGELGALVADHLDLMDDVLARLVAHADAPTALGLTGADDATGEQWDAGQVWAHLAEFGAYWRRELRRIVDTSGTDTDTGEPVPFGRTKRDPRRIEMIEAHRLVATEQHIATVTRDVAAFRADLAELTTADWQRRGSHETLGDMDLWTFLQHFVTGHYAEHADQLDELRRHG